MKTLNMDHPAIEEHNLVERYVLGRLSNEEQVRFEEHFAECEACVTELELAADLDAGLRVAVAEDTRRVVEQGFFAALMQRAQGPWAGLALGALALAVALPMTWFGVENQRLKNDLNSLRRPHAQPPTLLLTVTRDEAATPPTFSSTADSAWLTLAIETADGPIETYDVVLKDEANATRWQAEALEPNLWNVLQINLPKDLLLPGTYRLELEGLHTDGQRETIGVFPFRLDPTPGIDPSGD